MNKDSREKNSIRNFAVGISYQVVILALNLISKTYFIKTLGTTYLGINGLFTNIFLVLSFAEHGIGPVMMYTLYGPFANADKTAVTLIYKYFQKIYRKLSILIAGAGLVMIPIIPSLIKTSEDVGNVQMAFSIYLIGIVVSNAFAYKTHMVISDQRKYLVGAYQFTFDA